MDAAAAFRAQADTCRRLGSAMYGDLLVVLADDLDRGGPTQAMLDGHRDDPGRSALGLRVMGGLHRLVLERRTPLLALTYPTVGGTYEPALAARAVLEAIEEHADELRRGLASPPQTNEVGRSVALYAGLVSLPWELPVRLIELGCSAGLNLRADRFRYDTDRGPVGATGSCVRIADAWRGGGVDREVQVVERWGCDLNPVDVTTDAGRLRLSSYVWADQLDRWDRLKNALRVADEEPATVVQGEVLDELHRLEPAGGVATVVWHSVMRQYLSSRAMAEFDQRVAEIGAAATREAPVATITLEPELGVGPRPDHYPVVLRTWPGDGVRVLGRAAPHGPPLIWS